MTSHIDGFEIPDWAPPGLDKAIQKTGPEGCDVILRLVTGNEMKAAWSSVLKHWRSRDFEAGHLLALDTVYILSRANERHLPRAEKAAPYRPVASAARAFASALTQSGMDDLPERWLPDESRAALFRVLSPGNDQDDSIPEINALLQARQLTLAEIALEVAREADAWIDQAMNGPIYVPRPGNQDAARRLYFIRVFAGRIRRLCAAPLHLAVARFASAALEETITEDQIDDAMDPRRYEPPP